MFQTYILCFISMVLRDSKVINYTKLHDVEVSTKCSIIHSSIYSHCTVIMTWLDKIYKKLQGIFPGIAKMSHSPLLPSLPSPLPGLYFIFFHPGSSTSTPDVDGVYFYVRLPSLNTVQSNLPFSPEFSGELK